MERILELMQVRTAVPFGYLAFAMMLCVVAAAGLLLFVAGLFLRKSILGRVMAVVGWVVFCGVVVVIVANLLFDSRLNMNPTRVTSEALIGEWLDGKTSLRLAADGSFTLQASGRLIRRLGTRNASGNWSQHDSRLHLRTTSGQELSPLRVIQFGKQYRIIVDDFGDPDEWDGRLGFKRTRSG